MRVSHAAHVALREAEDRARQSQALLERASALGHLGAWAIRRDSRVAWSKETLAILGYQEQDSPRLEDAVALLDPNRRAELRSALGACMREGTPFDIECMARTVDRRSVWLRLIGEPDRDSNGHIVQTIGAVQDVTAKREAADRLQELGDRLTTTLESITDALFTVDRQWRFTYINGEAEKLFGRSRQQLIGKIVWSEFPSSAGTVFHDQYKRAIEESTTVKFEAWSQALGRQFQVAAYPSVQGLAVYFRDVTEAARTREALVESEERYRLLFHTSVDAVFETSPDGGITSANPAACALFGRSQADLCAGGRASVVAAEDVRVGQLLEERRRTGQTRGQLTMVRGDGSRFEAEVASAEYMRHGRLYTSVVVRDITQRLAHEQEILALNQMLSERVCQRTAELEAANAELRSFAHSVAHDLRSPIAAIDGFGGALEECLGPNVSPSARHYVGRMRAAARRMNEFVDALLSMAQVSQKQLVIEAVDLSSMASAVLSELREGDRTRRVNAYVQPGLSVRGDRRLLRMLLENLISNAWKFTSNRPVAEISFTATQQQGALLYCIRDNGAGFDMKYVDKLFGSFQRLHAESEFPGTGVGLANVARIVRRHGGRVWAEGVEDVGAAFYFTLPAGEL